MFEFPFEFFDDVWVFGKHGVPSLHGLLYVFELVPPLLFSFGQYVRVPVVLYDLSLCVGCGDAYEGLNFVPAHGARYFPLFDLFGAADAEHVPAAGDGVRVHVF